MTWLARFKVKKPRSLAGLLSRKNKSLPHSPAQDHELDHEAATVPLPSMTDFHKDDGEIVKPTTEKVPVVSQVMEAEKAMTASEATGDANAAVKSEVPQDGATKVDEDYTLVNGKVWVSNPHWQAREMPGQDAPAVASGPARSTSSPSKVDKAAVPEAEAAADTTEAVEGASAGLTTALDGPVVEEVDATEGLTAALDAPDAIAKPLDATTTLEKVEEAPAAAVEPVEAAEKTEADPGETSLLADLDTELDKGDKALIDSEEVTMEVDGSAEATEEPAKTVATKEVKLEADSDTAAVMNVPEESANTLDAPAAEPTPPPPPPKTPYEEFLDDFDAASKQVAAKQSKVAEVEKQIADLEAKGAVALPSLEAAKRELRHATVEKSIAEKRLEALKEEDARIAKIRKEAEERDTTLDNNTNSIKDLLVQLEKTQAATVDSAAAARKAQMEAQKKAEEEEAFLAELAEDKELVHVHENATQALKTAIEKLKAKDAELSKMKLQDLANYNAVVDAEEHVSLYQALLKEARADREKMTEDVSDEESIQTLGRVHTYEEKLELTQNRLKAAKETAAKLQPDFERTQAEFAELQALLLEELQKCHSDASSRESIKAKVAPPPPPVKEEVPPPQPEAPAKPVKAKSLKKDTQSKKEVQSKKEAPIVVPIVQHAASPASATSGKSGRFRSKSGEFIRTKSSFGMTIKKLLMGKKAGAA